MEELEFTRNTYTSMFRSFPGRPAVEGSALAHLAPTPFPPVSNFPISHKRRNLPSRRTRHFSHPSVLSASPLPPLPLPLPPPLMHT